jgi:hypothetical protein
MEGRERKEETRQDKEDESAITTYATLLRHDKRVRRWRQQIKDVYDDLDFMNSVRLSEIRERLRLICEEMDKA